MTPAFDSRLGLSTRNRVHSATLSILAHLAVCAITLTVAVRAPRVAPFKLPGTAKGTALLTYYSPGSLRPSASPSVPQLRRSRVARTQFPRKPVVQNQTPLPPQPQHADSGPGSSAESGIGEGDIRIALLQHFPYPRPDLSAMTHGSKGDVVLDAVIDEQGHVTTLTLLKGLAPSIDETVIATVKGWLFTPATKDGVPVVSEQEFYFHYERA